MRLRDIWDNFRIKLIELLNKVLMIRQQAEETDPDETGAVKIMKIHKVPFLCHKMSWLCLFLAFVFSLSLSLSMWHLCELCIVCAVIYLYWNGFVIVMDIFCSGIFIVIFVLWYIFMDMVLCCGISLWTCAKMINCIHQPRINYALIFWCKVYTHDNISEICLFHLIGMCCWGGLWKSFITYFSLSSKKQNLKIIPFQVFFWIC